MADTKTRILTKTGELFRRNGYVGTGLKQIATEADAPFGSIYHFFPGGKQQLAAEVIRAAGRMYQARVAEVLNQGTDPARAMEVAFAEAAQLLIETDFADACPIATIALEVASTNEPLRQVTADVFTEWIDAGIEWFVRSGYPRPVARELSIAFLNALEGAFVLARALRSTEPLEVAGATMSAAVSAAAPAPGREG
jgi:AcrR family transcriptional regulator